MSPPLRRVEARRSWRRRGLLLWTLLLLASHALRFFSAEAGSDQALATWATEPPSGAASPSPALWRLEDPASPALPANYERVPWIEAAADGTPHSVGAAAKRLAPGLEATTPDALLVARGRGALPALALAAESPEHVRGVLLVEPSGFGASELLGSDLLNRLLFRLVAALQWSALELLPHFGALDSRIPRVSLWRILASTNTEALLVAPSLAEVPVAILATADHTPAAQLASQLPNVRWQQAVASPAQLRESVEQLQNGTLVTSIGAPSGDFQLPRVDEAQPGRFALLVFGASLVSEDLACIGVGLLLGAGRVSLLSALAVAAAALLLGDLALYGFGRLAGGWLRNPRIPVTGEMLFWSRFLPGARLPTYVAAGLARMPFPVVLAWLGFAVLIWTPSIVLLTAAGGALVERTSGGSPVPVLIGVGVLLLALRISLPLLRHRERRRWVGRWLRVRRFEYWPVPVFYLPLLPFAAWQMLKQRSVRAPTLANPGIEGGGLIGESKWSIYEAFPKGSDYLPATQPLPVHRPVQERIEQALAFVGERGLAFPLILKPDVAERGRGLQRIASPRELERAIREAQEDLLLQEFVAGEEFGAFTIKRPGSEERELLALVSKQMPWVEGDGVHSVEALVLDDPRAVAMAAAYERNLGIRFREIPAAGERVSLVSIGTHSRGCLFVDAGEHRTPELCAAIGRIACDLPGFYFGRIDLRAPSLAALRRGEGIRVLEVNGVSAETAHFYDPSFGALDAYRALFEQWALAFAIGREQLDRGLAAPSYHALWSLWRRGRASSSHDSITIEGTTGDSGTHS